ncbi:unnamed protein product [Vitrella brassicaformis CCMP3155]|uniref:Chromate transporter n=2 Tax=Vitrella brassicaformis TaxID=1169539 RepID=A0A0G4EPS7_VITBC|nr:unnamed protein product [Vitrella brassicaformis CCMP3155]|mmetsp:Transcript_9913/g.24097  ORF Transcript_9913/g.24097 Transcript_9913/m.24097 type:complete len:502 (+) Transcript_9913:109-1614(+)|eukprot:CEL99834.1 unnamed protein product [Vitrella brassicaformis CCMP3155]
MQPKGEDARTLEMRTNGTPTTEIGKVKEVATSEGRGDSDDQTKDDQTSLEIDKDQDDETKAREDEEGRHEGWRGILTGFGYLGFVAFGGPMAHLGIYEKEFVERRKWISMGVFTEMIALGQCLPGPTSTQISFALGTTQAGLLGGIATGLMFLLPGFIIQTFAGYGLGELLKLPDSWIRGLTGGLGTAGVALVWSAAYGLGKKLLTDWVTQGLGVFSAVIAYYHTEAWTFPTLIVFGGIVTTIQHTIRHHDLTLKNETTLSTKVGKGIPLWLGGVLLFSWAAILIIMVCVRPTVPYEDAPPLHWFEAFYRIGSFIFGGGQVVLPMILETVVQFDRCDPDAGTTCVDKELPTVRDGGPSWISQEEFLTGLAVAQAMPGPLFNISGYIGVLVGGAGGAFLCWIGLFLPGILLIFGVLPFWTSLRKTQVYRRALPGLNASAVGLVFAACAQLSLSALNTSPFPHAAVCIGFIAFAMVFAFKISAPLAVIAGGALGVVAWAADMN